MPNHDSCAFLSLRIEDTGRLLQKDIGHDS